jgi:hypothetical protein
MKKYGNFIKENLTQLEKDYINYSLSNGYEIHFTADEKFNNIFNLYNQSFIGNKDLLSLLVGKRVRLTNMNDQYGPKSGELGTIDAIDSAGTLHMKWDNGSTLGLITGSDDFVILGEIREEDPEVILEDYDLEDTSLWLSDFGRREWVLKSNPNITDSRAYYWSKRVLILDETEGREVKETTTIDKILSEIDKWEAVKPEEEDPEITI